GEALDAIVAEIRPSVFIAPTLFCSEALVLRYRYDVPVVLLRASWPFSERREITRKLVLTKLFSLRAEADEFLTLLGKKVAIRGFQDVADLVLLMQEIILFPREFAADENSTEVLVHYISPGIANDRVESAFARESKDCSRPLIYCSLGSQS